MSVVTRDPRGPASGRPPVSTADSSMAEPGLLARVTDGGGTAARILALVGAGHGLTGFRSHVDEVSGRGLLVLSVAHPRYLPRLQVTIESLGMVRRCTTFDALLSQGVGAPLFEVERYDLRGRNDVPSARRHEALIAVRVDGRRELGVGEAADAGDALTACFASLPSVVAHAADVHATLVTGQLGPAGAATAYAWSVLSSGGRTQEALVAGASTVTAGVNALAAAYAALLAPHRPATDHRTADLTFTQHDHTRAANGSPTAHRRSQLREAT